MQHMNKLKHIALLVLFQFSIKAQTYYPLPNTKAIWTIFHYGQFGIEIQKFGMEGDTIINNLTYKKIYQDYAPSFNLNNAYYRGAIRETNKKIFMITYFNNFETILYDFNLNVGDTAKTITFYGVQHKFKVDSIDYVIINGQSHKRWKFNASGLHSNEYWIEGIGSSFGLLYPLFNATDNCYTLLCTSQDSSIIYQYSIPANPDCYWPITYDCDGVLNPLSVYEYSIENNKSIIFPNPFSNSAILKTNIELNNATLKIYDILGQEVLVYNYLNGNEIKISKGNLNNGNYYYHITQSGNLISKGKFIIE